MKFFIKFFQIVSVIIIAMVIAVKYIQKCSWKEAAGITIDIFKEMKASCPICKCFSGKKDSDSCQ